MPDLEGLVIVEEDGTVTVRCPSPTGCGHDSTDSDSRWVSNGWAEEKHARERLAQHIQEHLTGVPMQSLHDFEVERGLRKPAAPTVDLAAILKEI